MVRTKKHFRSPSPSSGSSSSEDEDDTAAQPQMTPRGTGKQLHLSGGKQLSVVGGGGKQLSVVGGGFRGGKQLQMAPQEESEEESSSSSSSESEEEPTKTVTYTRKSGGGKQLRVPGGKQLRPPPAQEEEEEDSDSEDDDEKAVYRPSGSGKQFGGKAFRGGKQLVRPPSPDDDSDSSSEEEEEVPPPTTTAAPRGQASGKQLRMQAPAEDAKKEESADDMEESSEDEDYEEAVPENKAPLVPPKPAPVRPTEPEESSSEEEVVTKPKRRGRPAAPSRSTRSTRSSKKVVDSSDDDDSSEEELELDMETFDNNKLIKNEADRKMLDKLPELEREAILAERFEELKREADMKKALRDIKRKEKEQKKQAKPKAKAPKKRAPPKKEPPKKRGRKAKKDESESSEDDQDEDYDDGAPDTSADAALAAAMSGKRVSARNLDAKGNKFKRQAALAKIRQNRANKTATKDESDSDLDYGKDSDDSDDDYEESSMLKPWQQKGRKTQLQRESTDEESIDEKREKESSRKRSEDVIADVHDFGQVTIPRRRLIRWCNEPFFEEAVKNSYVRLGIGRDSKTQKSCYRLCKVVGVEARKEYSFPPEQNQKPITTDKWLKISFGKNENVFKMITISDHRPTEDDVNKYISQLKIDRKNDDMLLKKKALKIRKRQDNLVNNYTYTKEDIEKLVIEKKKRNKKASNIGLEKTHIAIAVQAAKDAVKDAEERLEQAKITLMEADESAEGTLTEEVALVEATLEDAKALLKERIEEQQKILKDEEERNNRLKGSSKVQNWVKVNQRARLANQNADFLSYKDQLAKEKAEASAEPKFDPFARRKVKPKNLWEVGGKQPSEKISDADGTVEEEKKDSHPSEDATKDVGKERNENATPKPYSSGQSAPFVFDDDINIADIASLGLGMKKAANRMRTGISLDDYQSRKTAGTL